MLTPPSAAFCCQAAPQVLEFDQKGVLVGSWGGPGAGYAWPQQPGGITVDAKGNVWIAAEGFETAPVTPASGRGDAVVGEAPAAAPARGRGAPAGPADGHVLKFSRDGKFLLQIGTPGKNDGPDSQTTLDRPAAIAVDDAANEVFVADAGNRRVVVFDADTGAYKRHWFALRRAHAGAAPAAVFARRSAGEVVPRRHLHRHRPGRPGLRVRPQQQPHPGVPEGRQVREGGRGLEEHARRDGVRAVRRGVVVRLGVGRGVLVRCAAAAAVRGRRPRQESARAAARHAGAGRPPSAAAAAIPGQFLAVGSIAVDAQGNVYTGEQHHGKRVQKFVAGR